MIQASARALLKQMLGPDAKFRDDGRVLRLGIYRVERRGEHLLRTGDGTYLDTAIAKAIRHRLVTVKTCP